jgi:hypothetical protein
MQKISSDNEPRCYTEDGSLLKLNITITYGHVWYGDGFGWPTFSCQCVALEGTFNLQINGLLNIRIKQQRTCLLIGWTIQYLSSSKTRTGSLQLLRYCSVVVLMVPCPSLIFFSSLRWLCCYYDAPILLWSGCCLAGFCSWMDIGCGCLQQGEHCNSAGLLYIYIYIYIRWNAASFVTAGLLAAFLFVLLHISGVCSQYVLLALLPSHEVPFLVQGPGQRSQCFAPFTAILHSIVPAILEVDPSFSYVSTALLLLILALQSRCRNWCCCWFCCVSLVRSLGCFALLLHFQYSDR